MATTIAKLIAILGLDKSEFDKGVEGAEKRGNVLGNTLHGLGMVGGGVLAAGLGAATAAAVLLGKTIGPASDLGESANAINVVFTDAADILHEYGKTAATTVGLSTRSFNQLSSVTGAFLTNLGFDSKGAANETIKLTERAADMASVFNTDVSSALAAIQSGLKGEFNPLEQFGVKLNAATINERALAMGLANTEEELTDSNKATAALALIYEQTDKVAGDFANTSDGLANMQRIFAAQVENTAARFGTKLLPALTSAGKTLMQYFSSPAVQAFLDTLAERIGALAQAAADKLPIFIQNIKSAFGWLMDNKGVIVAAIAVISAAVLAFIATSAAAMLAAAPAFLPVLAVILLIAGAAYLLYQAWTNNWGGIQQKTAAVIAFIQPFIQQLITWLQTNIPIAIQYLTNLWNNVLMPALRGAWSWMQSVLFPFLKQLGDLFMNTIGRQIVTLVNIINANFLPILKQVASWLGANLMPVLKTVGSYLFNNWVNGFKALSRGIETVTGWLQRMNDMLSSIQLPSWLTPGSPTPFELGLLGIADAMQRINSTGLPSLSAGSMTGAPVGAGAAVININFSSNGITDEKEAARKIVGAVNVILRDKGLS